MNPRQNEILARSFSSAAALSTVFATACLPLPVPSPPREDPTTLRAYDFRSKTRMGGEILSIDDLRADDAAFSGLHITMRIEKGEVSVHLGPKEFFDSNVVAFRVGDSIDITGYPSSYKGKPALVATDVEKDGRQLRLPTRGVPVPSPETHDR
jgi:hypothetical protein